MSLAVPDDVSAALRLTAGFDAVLTQGFARLTPAQTSALDELADAFAGTPLHARVAEAVRALAAGEILAHHLAAVAAARAALEGARADALLAVAAASLGLTVAPAEVGPAPEPSAEATIRMESARQWLVEIGLAGLQNLDDATIVPIVATLEGLQAMPELGGLSAVLTGFADELLDHAPTSALDAVPARRWADLWCHALLATYALPEVPVERAVRGLWLPIGADVRHHDHLLSVVVHGLLEVDGDKHLVRSGFAAWKVDAITGAEIWNLVTPQAPRLFAALADDAALEVVGMALCSDGMLRWDDAACTPADGALDLAGAVLHAPAPRHRHPLQIAVPVRYRGEAPAPLDLSRTSPHIGLEAKDLDRGTITGLLRFDEAFSVQPMSAVRGSKRFGPAAGLAAAAKVKQPVLDVLRERASKLLRK